MNVNVQKKTIKRCLLGVLYFEKATNNNNEGLIYFKRTQFELMKQMYLEEKIYFCFPIGAIQIIRDTLGGGGG